MQPSENVTPAPPNVEASLDYLTTSSRINRRYVAAGAELNTGTYAPHRVLIRNGRLDRAGRLAAAMYAKHCPDGAPRESIEFRTIAYFVDTPS